MVRRWFDPTSGVEMSDSPASFHSTQSYPMNVDEHGNLNKGPEDQVQEILNLLKTTAIFAETMSGENSTATVEERAASVRESLRERTEEICARDDEDLANGVMLEVQSCGCSRANALGGTGDLMNRLIHLIPVEEREIHQDAIELYGRLGNIADIIMWAAKEPEYFPREFSDLAEGVYFLLYNTVREEIFKLIGINNIDNG